MLSPIANAEMKRQFLGALVERMQQNPIPHHMQVRRDWYGS
ncbi:hypothetical protein [Nodosilinea sp. P-1105]